MLLTKVVIVDGERPEHANSNKIGLTPCDTDYQRHSINDGSNTHYFNRRRKNNITKQAMIKQINKPSHANRLCF